MELQKGRPADTMGRLEKEIRTCLLYTSMTRARPLRWASAARSMMLRRRKPSAMAVRGSSPLMQKYKHVPAPLRHLASDVSQMCIRDSLYTAHYSRFDTEWKEGQPPSD